MLVQPALTTHLFCRPVSIADSTGHRWELQVLCEWLRCATVPSPIISQQEKANRHLHADRSRGVSARFTFSYCGGACPIFLSAHWMNYFMLGASVWPPSCCRHASWPSSMALIDRRHLRRFVVAGDVESLCAEQRKHAVRIDRGHKAALMIEPMRVAFLRRCRS